MDEHWARMKAAGRTDPDDTLSLQYLKFLKLFMDKNAERRMSQPTAPGTVRYRQDLKEAEAAACCALAKYIDIIQACAHHFGTVRRQHEQRELLERNLARNVVLVQLDYMENTSLPLGPEEAGDWYWATSREAVTTLGFYVVCWRDSVVRKEYYHYISQVLNHDSAHATGCLSL